MKLSDLEPQWRRYQTRIETWQRRKPDGTTEEVTEPRVYLPAVSSIAEAQGVEFLCPKCFVQNGGAVGTHMVLCWSRSRGVPDDAEPGPGRWILKGTSFADLTLDGEPGRSRSVDLKTGCRWHGFVTNGEVTPA